MRVPRKLNREIMNRIRNDMNQKTNPIEAGLGWITKFDKGDFIGRESIIQNKNKIKKRIFCFSMLDRAIPR